MSECYAMCSYQDPVPTNCDKFKGFIVDELCNNHDDNCNELVDENLLKGCYTGEPETLFVGVCIPVAHATSKENRGLVKQRRAIGAFV